MTWTGEGAGTRFSERGTGPSWGTAPLISHVKRQRFVENKSFKPETTEWRVDGRYK